MKKVVLTLLIFLSLSGCSSLKSKQEVIEVHRPILYCPAPNWEGVGRPDALATDGITEDMSAGEVVKRYKATVIQLQDYSNRLEKSLQQYDSTHEAYEQLRKQFLEEQKQDGFVGTDK